MRGCAADLGWYADAVEQFGLGMMRQSGVVFEVFPQADICHSRLVRVLVTYLSVCLSDSVTAAHYICPSKATGRPDREWRRHFSHNP